MNSSSEDRNPIELLAEEFLARHRRGERPTPTEYAERHPEHAAAIREAFPALLMMEQLKPVPGDLTGSLQFGAGPDDDPGIPPVIGEYRILRQIGRGGMGVVYEAVQESLGRHVALKVLPPTALGQSFLERFRREARAAARLHHTNIVPVFGTGEWHAEGVGPPVPYFAMQFIPGQGLDQVLDDVRRLRGAAGADFVPAESVARSLCSGEFAPARTGSDPDDRETPPAAAPTDLGSASELTDQSSGNPYYRSVARIGLQVAEALAYAHRMGVLHRDIKPSNLLLDPQGTAWVADFGLAKAEDNDDLTHTGDVVGTVRFMAPERFDGHSLPQSDVYSLGLTLYEMVALRPAFEERVREKLIKKVLQEPVPPLRQHDPAVPRDLETIIGKCVAKDPAERYASAQELAEDLRRYLADRPIRARRHTAAEKFWRWCRRNPAVAGLLGLALLLVVTVAVVSSAAAIQLREKNGQVTQALADAEKAERERREQLVEAYLEKARANRHSRRQGQRFETLDAIRKAAELARELHLPTEKFDAMRNEAIVALTLPDLRQAKSWDFFPLSFDALHQSYLRVEQGGRVSVRTVADDRERYGWTAFDPPTELSGCLSPDGQYVWVYAYWQDRRLKVWRLTGPEPAAVLAPLANVTAADFSRDSREVAVAGADGSLSRYDLATGNVVRTVKLPGVAQTLAYDPTADGRLAAGCGNTVFLLNRKTGEVTGKGWKHPAGVRALAWHPQGDLLAAADDDGKIYLWNPESAQQVSVLEGNKGGVWSINFNRRGDVLVSSDGEAMLRFWHPRMGKQLFATQGNQKAPGFDADDRHIAAHVAGPSGQWKNGLWEVASPKEYRTLVHDPVPGRPPQQWGASLHPNGRWLAVAMSDGPRIWDLDSGRQLAWLPIGRTYCVWFEPSGALLTSNPGGLWRWPVAVTMSDDVPRIGPPRRLPIPNIGEHVSTSRDGRVLAVPLGGGAAIIHADRPYQPVYLGPHEGVTSTAVSTILSIE